MRSNSFYFLLNKSVVMKLWFWTSKCGYWNCFLLVFFLLCVGCVCVLCLQKKKKGEWYRGIFLRKDAKSAAHVPVGLIPTGSGNITWQLMDRSTKHTSTFSCTMCVCVCVVLNVGISLLCVSQMSFDASQKNENPVFFFCRFSGGKGQGAEEETRREQTQKIVFLFFNYFFMGSFFFLCGHNKK